MGGRPRPRLKAGSLVMSIPRLRLLQPSRPKVVLSEALDEFEDRRSVARVELPEEVEQSRFERGELG